MAGRGSSAYDHLVQGQSTSTLEGTRDRTIVGIAYWFPRQGAVSSALLLDYEAVNNRDYAPSRSNERRWILHGLVNF